MHLDPLSRTVKIPIKIVKGKLCLFPSDPFPELKEGTVGDLVVPADKLKDKILVAELTREHKETFLNAHTRLIAMINPEKVPASLKDDVTSHVPGSIGPGVEFYLQEDQIALHRGTKNTSLMPCPCWIPCLNKDAKSINHAYTLISQAFELDRISHTGNVFTKVYYRNDSIWKPLKTLRGH